MELGLDRGGSRRGPGSVRWGVGQHQWGGRSKMRRLGAFVIRYVFGAISIAYLFTVGLLSARNRSLLAVICGHFGYNERSVAPKIPATDLRSIVPESVSIQVREPIGVDGNASLLEIIVLAKLIRAHNPREIFEIGTFDGRTTMNAAANSAEDAKVYTLDLPREEMDSTRLPIIDGDRVYIDKEMSGRRFQGTDCEKKIIQLYGDSAGFDFRPFRDRMDFVFVDGSHSYEYVLSDSRQSLGLLRNGRGVIVWHDYGQWDGVTKALNELYEGAQEFTGLKNVRGTSLVCLIR